MSPEFNKVTQGKLVPALAAVHNFRRLNNSIEEDVWDPDNEYGPNAPDPFLVLTAEPFRGYNDPFGPTAEDLSAGIMEDEMVRADARRDEIAAWMWASYQAHLAQI